MRAEESPGPIRRIDIMEIGSPKAARHPDRLESVDGDGAFPSLDIEFDERAGSIRVYDPRLFQGKRRRFCERLLEAAARQAGIRKAEVDLPSSSCQIEFNGGSHTPRSMADSFVSVVRAASAGSSLIDKVRWWRRRGRWSTITAFRLPDGVSIWETFDREPAHIRLRRPSLAGDRTQLSRVADSLADLDGVEACRVSRWSRRITIDVSLDSPLSDRFLDTVEQAIACLKAADSLRNESPVHTLLARPTGDVVVATGTKRLMYMALGGGSLAMTLVALVVPGVPTVPFLLATSYFLARSSPRLDERLRRSAFLGPILSEWEQSHGLSWSSKGKLIGLTVSVVAVSVLLAPLSPIALVLLLLISSVSIHGIAQMPDLEYEPRPALVYAHGAGAR
jgi:uncharacterized membrane protein YbaN (DUF454 family)